MQTISNHTLEDIRKSVGYLNGLVVILDQLHAEGRGKDGDDALSEKLQEVQEGVGEWAPVRYQTGAGVGWSFVSQNVKELAARLNEDLGLHD